MPHENAKWKEWNMMNNMCYKDKLKGLQQGYI